MAFYQVLKYSGYYILGPQEHPKAWSIKIGPPSTKIAKVLGDQRSTFSTTPRWGPSGSRATTTTTPSIAKLRRSITVTIILPASPTIRFWRRGLCRGFGIRSPELRHVFSTRWWWCGCSSTISSSLTRMSGRRRLRGLRKPISRSPQQCFFLPPCLLF